MSQLPDTRRYQHSLFSISWAIRAGLCYLPGPYRLLGALLSHVCSSFSLANKVVGVGSFFTRPACQQRGGGRRRGAPPGGARYRVRGWPRRRLPPAPRLRPAYPYAPGRGSLCRCAGSAPRGASVRNSTLPPSFWFCRLAPTKPALTRDGGGAAATA